jgi:tRNA nucleotidyltransferase (CCA-adding enzyme)
MDLDALAAVVAVKKLYPEAVVVLPDAKGEDVVRLLDDNPDLVDFVSESTFDLGIERLVVVDADSVDRLPDSVRKKLSKDVEIVVYDHHSLHFTPPTAKVHFKNAGSTTAILTLILKGKGIVPSPLEASVMLTGIYADTGSFRFPSTSPMDFFASAYLLSLGANLEFVKRYIPGELSDTELDIVKILKDNLTLAEVHGTRLGITYARFDTYVGEVAHLVSKLLDMFGVPAVFAVVESGGTTFLIGRSRSPRVNVSKVVARFGGGGHPEAGSATIKDRTVFEVMDELKGVLMDEVEPLKRAGDIMTSPPITVDATYSVATARTVLMKNGINSAPVVDSTNRMLGVVSRALLDRAVYMGLESEPVLNVMERDFVAVSPDTPVSKVEELVVERHKSFIPVVDGAHPVGVITRTDILMNLHRDEIADTLRFYGERALRSPKLKNISGRLKGILSPGLFALIEKIGALADELGLNAYIVGGFVRDLLMGKKNYDIDIVVEGDATAFARFLAKRLKAKVHTYDRFKTATLIFPDGTRLDFTSARTEVYRAPGALPEVDMAPIKKDLMRRDFTINALAVKINRKSFGELIDFFGGLRDIRDGKIRVLHSLSFVEDPTRILRALRFATRFRFELGKHTEKLLKMAVRRHLFKTVEGQRIYHELKQVFLEDNPLRVMNKMENYRIISSLFPGIPWDRYKKDLFERIRKVNIWHKLNFPDAKVAYYIPYFSALFFSISPKLLDRFLKELAVPEKESALIRKIVLTSSSILNKVSSAKKNSEVFNVLNALDEEHLLFLSALPEEEAVRNRVLSYLKDWRFVKPLVDGDDLKQLGLAPGPVFKELLDKVKCAIIDGELADDREEQLLYVRKLANAKVH